MKKIIKNTANSIRIHGPNVICHVLAVCSGSSFGRFITLKKICNIVCRYALIKDVFAGSLTIMCFLILLCCYTAAFNCVQEIFNSFKVSVILFSINIKNTRLA